MWSLAMADKMSSNGSQKKKKAIMKTVRLTPSTAKSIIARWTTMGEKDNNYFPECRKDANCDCNMCLDSFRATRDLIPTSNQKSSLTKRSSSRPDVEHTPIPYSSVISTSISDSRLEKENLIFELADARSFVSDTKEKLRSRKCSSSRCLNFLLRLSVLLLVHKGFSWRFSRIFEPVFLPETVSGFGEKSWVSGSLNDRFKFVENEVAKSVPHGRSMKCSCNSSKWEMDQDDHLLNKKCVLYKSLIEEVSIWGWPLQTAGLRRTGYWSSTLILLSGRVTEWRDGTAEFLVRRANSSWTERKWSSSVVQLDPSTWVLEYARSSVLENASALSFASEILKHKISEVKKSLNQASLLFSASNVKCLEPWEKDHHDLVPT